MEVSVDSLLENPKGMDTSKYIQQHSERLLPTLIDYVVSEPNIMLHNERQCYLYVARPTQLPLPGGRDPRARGHRPPALP